VWEEDAWKRIDSWVAGKGMGKMREGKGEEVCMILYKVYYGQKRMNIEAYHSSDRINPTYICLLLVHCPMQQHTPISNYEKPKTASTSISQFASIRTDGLMVGA
jgi:aryl-alcohol dehydrogenase-like predicted oxidoreductase